MIELPENLNTSNGTSFIYFCLGCRRLSKLPDNLNTSKGTEFQGFCSNCLALTKLPNVLDTGRCSYLTSLCDDCVALTKAKIILRYDANLTTIDASGKLTVESMRFIADRAPFLYTGKRTITFGAANLARANKYDPTILSTLDLKGWIVN